MKYAKAIGFSMLLVLILGARATLDAQELKVDRRYDGNGTLRVQATYYETTKGWVWHGPYTTWGENGSIIEQWEYYDGRKHGPYTWWAYNTENGIQWIVESGEYSNDTKVGEWFGTDSSNGKIREIDVYENGQAKSMKHWGYDSYGTLRYILTKELVQEDWNYHEIGYYDNGNKRYELSKTPTAPYYTVTFWSGDTWNGFTETIGLSSEGMVMEQSAYGRKTGIWTFYDPTTSRQRARIEYKDNLKHGMEIIYDSSGKVQEETQYQYGSRNGTYKYYYNGVLNGIYHYVNDSMEGGYEGYYSDGRLASRGTMKDGLPYGKSETWWSNGKQQIVEYWKEGGWKEGTYLSYYESGILNTQSVYVNGKLQGLSATYYESGDIKSQGIYSNGSLELLKKWWQDGTLQFVETYQDGVQHGDSTYYLYTSNLVPSPPGSYISARGSYCNGIICGSWIYGWLNPIISEQDGSTVIGWEYRTRSEDYGSVGSTYTTVNPNPYPVVQQNKEIRGLVKRADTGRPIAYAQVQIGTGYVYTDNRGYYSIQREPLDSYEVSFSKNGFSGHREAVDMKDKSYKTLNVLLTPKSASLPAVTKVESQYGNFFLQNVPVNNTYKASINWGGTNPGTVNFRVNGTDYPVTGNADGAVKVFNVGSDFVAGFNPKGNILRVTADNMNGTSPNTLTLNPIVIPFPDWSVALGPFTFEVKDNVPAYGLEKQWPAEDPMAFQISQKSLGDILWTAWGFFPLIGGKEFGIPPSQVGLGVKVKTDGSGSVSASGKMGFAVAGSTIENTLKGTGDVMYQADKGLVWTGASVETGLKGTVERAVGPVELIPALAGATQLRGVGWIFQWFNSTAKIKAAINVSSDLKLGIVNKDGKISFSPAEDVLRSGINLGLGMELMGAKATVSGDGAATLFWQVPANPDYLKSAQIQLTAKLEMAWKSFKNTFEKTHTLATTSSPEAIEGSSAGSTGFQPISRDFLKLGPYNSFMAPPVRTGRSPLLSEEAPTAMDSTLVTNVYPYAEPAIAGNNNKLAIAYVYNDPSKPELQATEIYTTYFDGTQFSTPAPISNDTRAEFAPTLAFDSNGKVVCAWERVKNVGFTGGRGGDGTLDMEAMAAEMEIVYAVYDPASGTWSAPSALTDNGYLDFKPMLKRGDNGSLLLVWQSNTGNLTIGSNESPTRIHFALWDANALQFGSPAQSSEGFVNAFGFSLAYRGPNAMLAFVKDADGDLSTTTDQEIYAALFDGTAWATSSSVTADAIQDSNPRVVYGSTGNLELVWRKGDTLVRLTDWNSKAYETIRTDCQNPTFSDFRLFTDPQDRLALIWQDIAAEKIDLFYMVYDSSKFSWSKDLRLTNDTPLEKEFQGFFSPDGTLHLTYVKEDRGTGINDLHYLTYQLKADLTASGQNLGTDPPNPAPGSAVSLSCRVDNVGDTVFSDVAVDFYLGDPNSGGQFIGRGVVAPSEIKAGASGSASVAWNVPANLNSYVVYAVVDPDNSAQEADENNNTAFFSPLLPDLVALQCRPQDLGDGSVDVTAVVKNNGAAPATGVEVLFKVNGSEIGVISLPQIKPGETAEISRLIWAGTDFSGEQPKIEVLVDPDGKIPESNKDNNRAFALFLTDPNFVAGPEEIVFERNAPGSESAPETILITNSGGRDLHITGIVLSDTTNFSLLVDGGNAPLGGMTGVIPGGQSRTIAVSFKPSGTGNFTANLTITTDDPDSPERSIPLRLREEPAAPRPVITVTPAVHDFGNIEMGGTVLPYVFRITNNGNADLTVTAVDLSDRDHFLLDLDSGDSPIAGLPVLIPAAQSRTLGVLFSTSSVGTRSANLTISSNDPDSPNMNVAVQGNVLGEPRPAMRLSPSTYFFGSVAVGSSSAPFAFSIINTGNAPLSVDKVTLTDSSNFSLSINGGNNPLGSLPVSIPAGENRTVTVTFMPSTGRSLSANLVIGSSDPDVAEIRAVLLGNDPPVPGDVNGDRTVTLADAILALQIAAGVTPAGQAVTNTADINNDGRIGMAEAIYILQKMAGLREN